MSYEALTEFFQLMENDIYKPVYHNDIDRFINAPIVDNDFNSLIDFIEYVKDKGYTAEQIIDFIVHGLRQVDIDYMDL